MKTYTPASSAKFLSDLAILDRQQSRVQRQISSGYRVELPSDSPEDLVDIVQLRSEVARATAVNQTLGRVQSEVNTGEASLEIATQLLERAKTIAAQTGTGTSQNRLNASLEVQSIQQQLVDLTKSMSSGRYVFSGDSDQSMLYDIDPSQPTGVVRHLHATNTRQIQDINGTSFSVTLTANEIFDSRDGSDNPDANNVFKAVNQLSLALQNDDESGVQASIPFLNSALDHLGRQLTFYGNCQNRVANAMKLTDSASAQKATELSKLQDTDITQAALDLSTGKVHREAALGAESQRPRTSLFDYLG